MLSIAICDDDENSALLLKKYTEEFLHTSKSFLLDVFSSGNELCNRLEAGTNYDLLLLDIEMSDCDGVSVAKCLRQLNEDTLIVFVSAHTKYHSQLFDVQPYNFISKPIEPILFHDIISKAFRKINTNHPFFEWSSGGKFISIPTEIILYFETAGHNILLTTKNEEITIKAKLSDLQKCLSPLEFVLINQSFLVNARNVKSFKSDYIVTGDNRTVYISRNQKKPVKQFYLNYWEQEMNR